MTMRAATLILALLWLIGSGCSRASPPIEGFVKIDDMEGSGDFIEWTPPGGLLPGLWRSATDCTEADRISPPPFSVTASGWSYAELPEPQDTFPGVLSAHAARLFTISPLTGVWGASMGFDIGMLAGPDGERLAPALGDAGAPGVGPGCRQLDARWFAASPVDLSAYSGLTFWAMARNGAKSLRVQVPDISSDPRGGVCNAADPNDLSNCYNSFRTVITLTDTMTRYTVEFSTLQQDPTWGYRPTPDVLDLQHAYAIEFELDEAQCGLDPTAMCAGGTTPPLSFDVWVDDLYFVNK
jgi:hypothetical protein